MWEELGKLSARCAKHEVIEQRCDVCRALVANRAKLLELKMKRDMLVRDVTSLLARNKAIIIGFK
jgi:hypothetical protein